MADRRIRSILYGVVMIGILWSQIPQNAFAAPSDRHFSEIGLFDITEKEYNKQVERLKKDRKKHIPSDQLFEEFDDTYRMILQKAQNLQWMDIQTNLNRNLVYEDYPAQNSEYVAWNDSLCVIAKQICEDTFYQEAAKAYWGEELYQAYLAYTPLTAKQKKIVDQINTYQNQIDKLRADTAISFRGKQYTLSDLQEAQIQGDLDTDAYYTGYYMLTDALYDDVGELYLQMVDARNQLAQMAGYDNYMAYAYQEVYQRDYTYQDADQMRKYVIKKLLPDFLDKEQELAEWQEKIEMDTFTVEEGVALMKQYLPMIDPGFQESMHFMLSHELCDLDDAGAKVDFSFVADLSYDKEAFLSIHGISDITDLGVFAHELGHYNAAFHSSDLYWDDMVNNIDVAEIHSQGAELLSSLFYDRFTQDAAYAQANAIYETESQMIYAVTMDAIEKDIYTSKHLTLQDIDRSYAKWMSLYYGFEFDAGSSFAKTWLMQDVLFSSPCYFISYVTSGFTALDLFCKACDNYHAGRSDYRKIVYSDWELSYREMISEFGCLDPFSEKDFQQLSQRIRKRWDNCMNGKVAQAPVQTRREILNLHGKK